MLNKKVFFTIIFILILSIAGLIFQTLLPVSSVSPPTIPLSPTRSSVLYLDQLGIKGDGSVEGTAVQAALDYARDHSIATVVFPENKVIVTTSKITIHAGLNVIGNGSTIKLKENSGYPRDNQIMNLMENARCSGLKLDGQWKTNPGVCGIRLFSGSVFTENEVFNIGAYSIYTYNANNVTISNNIIHDGAQYGIATGGGDINGVSHNISVIGNTIYGQQEVGIKIRGTQDSVISNNLVTIPVVLDYDAEGINLYSLDYANSNIEISKNTVVGALGGGGFTTGIESQSSANTRIKILNNHISKCNQGIHILFNNGIITGNTISGCSNPIVNGGTGNTITNNILTTPSLTPTPSSALYLDQFGIKGDGSVEGTAVQAALDYAQDHSIGTVVFPEDKVIVTTSKITIHPGLNVIGSGSTIKLKENSGYPPDNQIMNLMENARCSGLKLDGQWKTNPGVCGIRLFSGSVFTENEVFNIGAYSIYTYNANNVTISNNIIHDGAQYGVATGGGDINGISHNILVIGNTIYNMQEVGIKIRGTDNSIISHNTVTVPDIPGVYSRGISLYSFDASNAIIQIMNNTVMGEWGEGTGGGIVSDNSLNTGITITGNSIKELDAGIELNFNNGIVTGNTISGCTKSIVNNGINNTIIDNILTT